MYNLIVLISLIYISFGFQFGLQSNVSCKAGVTCPDSGFCNPSTLTCADNKPTTKCGSYGDLYVNNKNIYDIYI